jgi:hypothetical protein
VDIKVSLTRTIEGDDAVTAEVAIGAFLKRFKADVREPDRWESWHMTLALLAFHRGNYRKALRLTETASIASSRRRWSDRVMGHPGVKHGARLVLLEAVFEGLRSHYTTRTLH